MEFEVVQGGRSGRRLAPGALGGRVFGKRIIVRCDTHAHLYPAHSVAAWVNSGLRATGGDPRIVPAVIVTERAGDTSFERFSRELPPDWVWTPLERGGGGVVSTNDGVLVVLRGAQYIAAEGIEVLDLARSRWGLPCELEGRPAREIVRLIREGSGVACLPWSPGKWRGERGGVVRGIVEEGTPGGIALGDIAMRPQCLSETLPFTIARERGLLVLGGSDPLPQVGEESLVGGYGTEFSGAYESSSQELVDWLFCVLREPGQAALDSEVSSYGRRNSFPRAVLRWVRNRVAGGRVGASGVGLAETRFD